MRTFHLNTELISRVDAVEFSYTQGRMNVIRDLRTDPECVNYVDGKTFSCLIAPKIPNPYFNRAFLSGPTELDQMQSLLQFAQSKCAAISIEVSPGAINPKTAEELVRAGFAQTEFHPIFLRHAADLSPLPASIEVRTVTTPEELNSFKEIYVSGWELHEGFAPIMKSYIGKWSEIPGWHLYLAYSGEQAVSCAVLFTHDGIAYLADATTPKEFRGRGGQAALLNARILAAKRMKVDYIMSRADFGSISHRNMEKIGLNVSYTRAVWTMLNGISH